MNDRFPFPTRFDYEPVGKYTVVALARDGSLHTSRKRRLTKALLAMFSLSDWEDTLARYVIDGRGTLVYASQIHGPMSATVVACEAGWSAMAELAEDLRISGHQYHNMLELELESRVLWPA
jgi:hypothetical protein